MVVKAAAQQQPTPPGPAPTALSVMEKVMAALSPAEREVLAQLGQHRAEQAGQTKTVSGEMVENANVIKIELKAHARYFLNGFVYEANTVYHAAKRDALALLKLTTAYGRPVFVRHVPKVEATRERTADGKPVAHLSSRDVYGGTPIDQGSSVTQAQFRAKGGKLDLSDNSDAELARHLAEADGPKGGGLPGTLEPASDAEVAAENSRPASTRLEEASDNAHEEGGVNA